MTLNKWICDICVHTNPEYRIKTLILFQKEFNNTLLKYIFYFQDILVKWKSNRSQMADSGRLNNLLRGRAF